MTDIKSDEEKTEEANSAEKPMTNEKENAVSESEVAEEPQAPKKPERYRPTPHSYEKDWENLKNVSLLDNPYSGDSLLSRNGISREEEDEWLAASVAAFKESLASAPFTSENSDDEHPDAE